MIGFSHLSSSPVFHIDNLPHHISIHDTEGAKGYKKSCFSRRSRIFSDWNAYFVPYDPNTEDRLFVGIALLGALIVTGALNLLRSMVVSDVMPRFDAVAVLVAGVAIAPVFRFIMYFSSIWWT